MSIEPKAWGGRDELVAGITFVRSPLNTAVSPSISEAVCSAMSASRSLISTLVPWAAKVLAVARSMPRQNR